MGAAATLGAAAAAVATAEVGAAAASHKPLRLPPIDGDAPREVKEPRTKGLEKRKRAVPKAFEMPAPPELLS